MAAQEIASVDKSQWGDGPWQDEPDRVEWEHAGLPCLMVRHTRSGHWCGYAAVPPSHPWHGKGYSDDVVDVEAHYGLTYAKACQGDVCHIPKPGEPDDVWWFGFDCAHSGDYQPSSNRYWGTGDPWPSKKYDHATQMAKVDDWTAEKYRPLDYVQAETNRLAEQLAAVQP